VFGEYGEVGVNHRGEVKDEFRSSFLKSDLGGIRIAIGIVGRNGAGDGWGTFELTKSSGWLVISCDIARESDSLRIPDCHRGA